MTFSVTYKFNIGYKILFKFDLLQGMQFGTDHVSGVQSPASHCGGSFLIPGQIMCDFLCGQNDTWTYFFPSTSLFTCRYHSIVGNIQFQQLRAPLNSAPERVHLKGHVKAQTTSVFSFLLKMTRQILAI